MKLASFVHGKRNCYGVVHGDEVSDLRSIVGAPDDLRSLLSTRSDWYDWINEVNPKASRIPLSDVRLQAPIPAPQKFLGLGGNYPSHLEEARKINLVRQPGQAWFNKQVSCVNGPTDPVHLPRVSSQFDYEGELGVVIGRRCRHVRREDAMQMVAGLVVVNDLSVSDWQMRSPTHMEFSKAVYLKDSSSGIPSAELEALHKYLDEESTLNGSAYQRAASAENPSSINVDCGALFRTSHYNKTDTFE